MSEVASLRHAEAHRKSLAEAEKGEPFTHWALGDLTVIFVIDCDLQGQIKLESQNLRKSKFNPFWACPHNSSSIQAKITKFGPDMQNTMVKYLIVLES